MHKIIVLSLLILPIAHAQLLPGRVLIDRPFPPELKAFLELTDAQAAAVSKANTDLNTFRMTKAQRQMQVQIELSQESAKQTIDPMALGLRHAELETIRREIAAEQQKTGTIVQNVLTAPQKTKLTVLQQSLQMYSLACTAVDHNVLNMPILFPGNIIPANRIDPSQPSFPSFLIGAIVGPPCNGVNGAPVQRGEFIFNPVAP
jgi:hypothetical protein